MLTCKVQLSEYKCSSDEVAQIDTFKTITSILFGINYPFCNVNRALISNVIVTNFATALIKTLAKVVFCYLNWCIGTQS